MQQKNPAAAATAKIYGAVHMYKLATNFSLRMMNFALNFETYLDICLANACWTDLNRKDGIMYKVIVALLQAHFHNYYTWFRLNGTKLRCNFLVIIYLLLYLDTKPTNVTSRGMLILQILQKYTFESERMRKPATKRNVRILSVIYGGKTIVRVRVGFFVRLISWVSWVSVFTFLWHLKRVNYLDN